MILGSMPSRRSLEKQQYYAHPRNTFWPIMEELFGFDAALPYTERLQRLERNHIALWDVARQCMRPGSLDADISEVQANDFIDFFTLHSRIRHVFFNGRKAEDMYRYFVLPGLPVPWRDLPQTCLPSTSPAHAARSFAQKLTAWQIVKQALETDSV